jgi:hypothetical protein
MPITIYSGLPGAGKSLVMADQILYILHRNFKWWKKSGIQRVVWSNLKLLPKYEERYKGFLKYWDEPVQLTPLRDVDIFWDEVATHMDNLNYQNTPLELKRWLQQHRKFGIEIYGNTQDFAMVDIAFRRMTSELFILRKLIGSPDRSNTKPPVKYIWGIILIRQMNPQDYKEDTKENKAYGFDIFLINRERIEVFDTSQEIKMGKYPPLKHFERTCEISDCNFKRVLHT